MMVELTYLVHTNCTWAHFSRTGNSSTKSGSMVLKHDDAKKVLGTPCDPGVIDFFEVVDESQVLEKIETMRGLGHEVEVKYLND